MDVSRETAEIYFNNGRHEDAVYVLEIIANEQKQKYGPNSERVLQTRTRIAEICEAQEKYAEALKTLLDIYMLKLKLLALNHPSPLDTRQRIKNLLLKHGSLDVMSQVMQDIEKTFRSLMKMIRKKYLNGQYKLALKEGGDILDDMMKFFGEYNEITLDMGCLVAVIHSHNEDYFKPLQIINEIYEKKKVVVGPTDGRMASTLMTKASIYLKMCSFEEALKCYFEAYSIRKYAFGSLHRKTLVSLLGIAEVTYTVGNYEEALSILTEIARIQEFYQHKELMLTKIHTGILEFARGNYEDALFIFKDIMIKKTTPKRIRALIQNKKGTALAKLGRYREARVVLKDACNTIRLTGLYEETLDTYRNLAVLLAKEGKDVTAHSMLVGLFGISAMVLGPRRSLVFSIQHDLAEFLLSRGKIDKSLEAFGKIWTYQEEKLGSLHPVALRAKSRVAKFYNAQGKDHIALMMFNEILPVLKAHFYNQHLDCLDVEDQIASIYIRRNAYAAALQIYYQIYEIIAENYAAYHPFLVEIIEKIQNITDHVPLSRVIESTLMHNLDDLITLVENGDDVNERDVNGAVALHYASREGDVRILTYLLSRGAIYDIKDMFGNTPESFAANNDTKFVFLLVKDLFECIESGDLEKMRKILQREVLIINARDSVCRTPLQRAVIKGRFEIVQELINLGAELAFGTAEDGNVLHMAADRGHSRILQLLLYHLQTSDLRLSRILIDSTNNDLGVTPLHVAAKKDRYECVELLINHSANPMTKDLLGKFPYDMGSLEMQQCILDYSFTFYNWAQAYNDGLFNEEEWQ